MDIKYFISIVSEKILVVLLIPLISTALAAYMSFVILDTQYEAVTTIYVTSSTQKSAIPVAYEDILISQQLVKDYREIIKSRSITKEVLEQLDIKNQTPEDLAKKIIVNLKGETGLFEIKVIDSDPTRAKALVDKLSSVFIARIKSLMNLENINVIDSAETPVKPIRPRHLVNILSAFTIGILFAISTILAIDYFDDTIKTVEDIEKHLEITVLGTIPVEDIE